LYTQLELGIPNTTPHMQSKPQGWRSRGYLPHYDSTKTFQFVTFRLADSLPQILLKSVEESFCAYSS
jgi:hypothetical protein